MNIFKTALIVLFLITTVALVTTKPVMHKAAILAAPDFTVASLTEPKVVVKSDFTEPLPPAQKQIVTKEVPVQSVPVKVQSQPVKVVSKPVKTVTQPVKTQPVQTTPKIDVSKIVQKIETPVVEEKPVELEKPVQKPVEVEVPVKLEPVEKPKVVTQPIKVDTTPLTEKEEIIAWNKWRSDLQNQVMKDSKISAPVGTTFHFSCTVDKFGNISNINTWSENDYYTPLAKRVIKPVLSGYQYQKILKFPERTRRTITNVTGSFTMAYTNRFSTPADYSDYERIK